MIYTFIYDKKMTHKEDMLFEDYDLFNAWLSDEELHERHRYNIINLFSRMDDFGDFNIYITIKEAH